mmetsp:Transcript_8114/g.23881  ORF Transcript_8114/g.23881 Transcript_8114/m.23881 type:complete len:422 (+) Transcript_8114:70-1335(+)
MSVLLSSFTSSHKRAFKVVYYVVFFVVYYVVCVVVASKSTTTLDDDVNDALSFAVPKVKRINVFVRDDDDVSSKKSDDTNDVNDDFDDGWVYVRHESTLDAVLALATRRDFFDDDGEERRWWDTGTHRRNEERDDDYIADDEEEDTEKVLNAMTMTTTGFSALEDFARSEKGVVLVSVCEATRDDERARPSFTASRRSWSASSAMYAFAAKAYSASSSAAREGNESVSMRCKREDFVEKGGAEKVDAFEKALRAEARLESSDASTSSALRRLSEELACFSERAKERFGEGKVSSAGDGEMEVAYAEICGMTTLGAIDATKKKKIEAFVEKTIEEVLERVGALGVVVAQAKEKNEVVKSQRRALLQDDSSSEKERSAKDYPNKATATIVGFILLIGAVTGFLAMLNMPFPTDSLLFPKTKDD